MALLPSCGSAHGDAADEASSNDDELVARNVAGAHANFHPATSYTDGEVYALLLRPDKTFFMRVKGKFHCTGQAGYECPRDAEGIAADTLVRGTWRGASGGIVLRPEASGDASDPIRVAFTITGVTSKLEATIDPGHRIFADFAVWARFSAPHAIDATDLAGTWKVVVPPNDGSQPTLEGMNMYVGTTYSQSIVFDAETKRYRNRRSDDTTRSDDGTYWIAGAPDGGGGSVLVLDEEHLFRTQPIVSIAGTTLTLDVNPESNHRSLVAERD